MSVIETRLSDCVGFGFQAIPAYQTNVVPLDNGKEQRNVTWTKAKRRYTAQYSTFTEEMFAELLACFHACAGSAYAFRFKDWSDFEATVESLGTTPGANQTPVQLVKTYTFGSQSRVRTILRPNAGSVIYQNGTPKAGTLNTSTGLFTPTTNWTAAAALTWTGTFDVPVRFASDEFPTTYADRNLIVVDCDLVEVFE